MCIAWLTLLQAGCLYLAQVRDKGKQVHVQAHTNNAVILHGRQTPSLESLSSPQREDDADATEQPTDVPAARRRLVRLHTARAARSAGASTPAGRLGGADQSTPMPHATGLSDIEPSNSRALALISPPTAAG